MFSYLIILFSFTTLFSQTKQFEFLPGSIYDNSIPKPAEILGYNIGDKPANYFEAVNYLKTLSEKSPLISLYECGQTHQGRKLYYLIATSPKNMAQLESIKSNLLKLSDPRSISESEASAIISSSPSTAMMMYSIHGNESSGTDAALQLTYHLAASKDETVKKLLDELVIIIYPMENPDGRERFISQAETWRGRVKNSDTQSFPHSGVWPSGRTNHYHFDLNRDWFILSQPESRARVKVLLEWHPQLVVDAHEMGSFSSFLFNPPREPINPNLNSRIISWWKVFAEDQAKAFDAFGKDYYTREWLEEWYPGYGSSYPSYHGAVSILYEQARTSGIEVKQREGTVLTFQEAVQNQFISSMANLLTAANNRSKILNDYYNVKKDQISKVRKDGIKYFVFDPSENPARTNKLIEILLFQGIEIFSTEKEFSLDGARNYWNEKIDSRKFVKESYIIPVMQPKQSLINAILEFDTRMDNKFLKWERESLEKGEGTKLYEVSSWSMPLAYGVDAVAAANIPPITLKKISSVNSSEGKLINPSPKYGYLIEFKSDAVYRLLLDLFESGYVIQSAGKPFKIENNSYERGTLLIRINENPKLDEKYLSSLGEKHGIRIIGVNTALSQKGPDLGGDEFTLLYAPRTAMLVDQNISMGNYGAMNYLFDYELGLRVSTINLSGLAYIDLRKYNVLILPSFWGSASSFKDAAGESGIKMLKTWIANGGTLIAVQSSAAALADSSLKISQVRLRRQSLSSLDKFNDALERENRYKNVMIDSISVWEGVKGKEQPNKKETQIKSDVKAMMEKDQNDIKFMPRGAILKTELDEEHWLNFGCGSRLPAMFNNSYVFLSKLPVQTPVRISGYDSIRLSGLLWPEAKERLENSAFSTRESNGRGQIILFANEPNFRSYFYGTARLLLNAVLLGPGYGASQPVEW